MVLHNVGRPQIGTGQGLSNKKLVFSVVCCQNMGYLPLLETDLEYNYAFFLLKFVDLETLQFL